MFKNSLVIISMILSCFMAKAQNSVLLKDIHPSGNSCYTGFVEFEGKTYFIADDGIHGIELWVTDGTEENTHIVKDINTGIGNSSPNYQIVVNDKMYFAADDGISGVELWITDGTESGTQMVKDINPDGSGSPVYMTAMNNKIYFSASNGLNEIFTQDTELWVTDGTEDGTSRVKDIAEGYSSSPRNLIVYNNKLYFAATDEHGEELWVSDGTEAGTMLLKDIHPGDANTYSSPGNMIVYNGKLYLSAYDGNFAGGNFWTTDGTEDGTTHLNPQNGYVNFAGGTIYNDLLVFSGDNGMDGLELWKTDGTSANTEMIMDINPAIGFGSPVNYKEVNDQLFFVADDGTHGAELWVTDGTTGGTSLLHDINTTSIQPGQISRMVEFNSELYFVASADYSVAPYALQLYHTDGTSNGLEMVSAAGANQPSPFYGFAALSVCNGSLFYLANYSSNVGREPYMLDTSTISVEEEPTARPQLYPNPASASFNLKGLSENDGKATLRIIDINGRLVYEGLLNTAGRAEIQSLSEGLYQVLLITQTHFHTLPLMIQR